MQDFAFYNPTSFLLAKGAAALIGPELKKRGKTRVFMLYGKGSVKQNGTYDKVINSLKTAGLEVAELSGVRSNPEVTLVREAAALARDFQPDVLLALGGGSVIDTTKALAIALANPDHDVWDFYAKRAKANFDQLLDIAAIVTIPAAGSEASASSVISNDQEKLKLSCNNDALRPKLALLDPELTLTLPARLTFAGICDMMIHIMERFFSAVGPVPISDELACGALRAIIQSAEVLKQDLSNYDARANIMWAASLAHNDLMGCGRSAKGLAGRAGGWESHALEHELSAKDPSISHGEGLAVIFPAWCSFVWPHAKERFLTFAKLVFGLEAKSPALENAVIEEAIQKLKDFFLNLGMPDTLDGFGLTPADIDDLISHLKISKGEMIGELRPLNLSDAAALYRSCFN